MKVIIQMLPDVDSMIKKLYTFLIFINLCSTGVIYWEYLGSKKFVYNQKTSVLSSKSKSRFQRLSKIAKSGYT